MILIVDAYNVLKQLKQGLINQFERSAFIKKIKSYARDKQHSVIVVFDGGDCRWPMIEKESPVTIVYSGERLSADDYIRRYLKEHKHKELLLVTDDRELKKNASRYDIDTMKSLTFYDRVISHIGGRSDGDEDGPLIQLSSDAPSEVSALMDAIEKVPAKNEEHSRRSRQSSGFTPSKKERKIHKKMKKL